MKKLFSLICVINILILNIAPLFVSAKVATKKPVTINVYNWGEYISDGTDGLIDVNKEFTRRTGIQVNYTTYQNNEELSAKLLAKGASYDVIFPSDYTVDKLRKKDMLEKLDFNKIPNFSKIDSSFYNPNYDPTNEYSVPYTWGVVGIFYNKKFVTEPEEQIGWNILWNEKYKGKILMFDNSRDAFGIAQILLGKSVNSSNPKDYYDAADKLSEQHSYVQAYVMDQIYDKIRNEEAVVAPYYSGDAAVLTKDNPNIGFVIPKEGTTKFIDAMCIPKGAEHPNEAMQYINFMCETDIGLANVSRIGYSTPQKEVKNLLDPEVSNNEIFYPSEKVLSKSQIFTSLPNDIGLLLDDLWVQIKAGGNGNAMILVIVLCSFLGAYIFIVAYKRLKARREFRK